jgi:GNAT superfamily N-acetyltransferase
MSDVHTLREAMTVVHGASDLLLRCRPGVTVGQVGALRHVHCDVPLWWETDAFQAVDARPEEVVGAVRAARPGPHLIGVATTDPEGIVAPYAALGYKTVPSEPLEIVMARGLRDLAPEGRRWPVQRVHTEAQRQTFNAGLDADDPHGQMDAEELCDLLIRRYFVELDGRCVCRGTAILPSPEAVTVEPLGTDPEYRRRGLATALMGRLHAEAAQSGAVWSVIVATAMGAALYAVLGYGVVGYIQKFVPAGWQRADYP